MRRNLITDVAGLSVGHADDAGLASGVTAILFDRPAIIATEIRGGAPAGRTHDFTPGRVVDRADAVLLSGGSAFGLDATGGAMAYLRDRGRGLSIGSALVPIVAQAICFDLLNGGDKQWGRRSPYEEMGHAACEAAGLDFALGTAGGGYGATTFDLKGGIGSASAVTPSGFTVGAIAVVNAVASSVIGGGPHFWAGAYEVDAEFGGLGLPPRIGPEALALNWKGGPAPEPGTTIVLVATDADLSVAEVKRLAIMADDGLPRALRFAHAPFDGDTLFAAATARRAISQERVQALTEIGALAGDVVARAIARGVHAATALPFAGALPDWRGKFSRRPAGAA
jgi:L-aminopeptidase/D-esterase-like protein